MALTPLGSVDLPPFRASTFDHGDVHLATGRIFVAHTAAGTVEVIDGERRVHIRTIASCPEASGILSVQDQNLIFAAARGAGKVLVIDAASLALVGELTSGPRPNGVAWDGRRRRLLTADVQDSSARLLDIWTGENVGQVDLPGRPRWCVYDPERDRFLVNIRDPACIALLTAEPLALSGRWPASAAGPHGLDLDVETGRAFVACDAGMALALDLANGRELGACPIGGAPDAIWYNAYRQLLYVAIGDPGLVEVIDTVTMTRQQQIPTEAGAHTTAFDRARQQLAVFLPGTCRAALYQEG
jgi:DNA-binding beta-propeller fold protein YncE